MIVEFKPKLLLNKIVVTPETKIYYEQNIKGIIDTLSEHIDITNIEKIIIPEDFVNDVLEYQRELGFANPSLTYNEYGKAYGKLLYNKSTNKHIVFLDPDIATFLMDDTLRKSIFANVAEEHKDIINHEIEKALNLLAHELSHAEFDAKVKIPDFTSKYYSQLENLSYHLLDEYYACRKSSYFSEISLIPYDKQYIYEIEQRIIDEKWKYKTGETELNKFCKIFHSYTQQCLINIVAVLGSQIENLDNKTLYDNCYINIVIDVFKNEFDKLYVEIQNNKNITIPNSVLAAINSYYESFGIYISEQSERLFYSIPD